MDKNCQTAEVIQQTNCKKKTFPEKNITSQKTVPFKTSNNAAFHKKGKQ